MENNGITKNVVVPFLISSVLGFLFCLKFSLATSPIYGPSFLSHDAAIFYIIGKYWSEGVVPYLELWDHKGPMIFFVNLIGHVLTSDTTGVFLVQCLSIATFVFFVFKTFRTRFSAFVSWLLSLVSLFWLACSYEGGDLTEEFLLPYLSAAVYLTVIWIGKYEQSPRDHNPWNAFLLGVIFGFSFLTRLTNALGACGAMSAIGLVLLRDRRWKNLSMNVLGFAGGALALTVPFAVYFTLKGAFPDFIFGSFTYNVSNMNATTGGFSNDYWLRNIFAFSIMSVNCFALVFVSLFMFFSNPKHRVGALVWLLSSFFLSWWLFRSSLMSHYRTVALPFFPVIVMELFRLKRWFHPYIRNVILALLIAGPIFITFKKWTSFTQYFDRPCAVEAAEHIKVDLPAEDIQHLIVYGDPQLYLLLDIKPIYRNFSFPGTQGVKSERLKKDIQAEYSSLKAKFILVSGDASLIQDILDSSYVFVREYGNGGRYKLWQLR